MPCLPAGGQVLGVEEERRQFPVDLDHNPAPAVGQRHRGPVGVPPLFEGRNSVQVGGDKGFLLRVGSCNRLQAQHARFAPK